MEEIHELHQRTHFQKIAIFAIVAFLILISAVLAIVAHTLQNEQAMTIGSKASESDRIVEQGGSEPTASNDRLQNDATMVPASENSCSIATFYKAVEEFGVVTGCRASVYCGGYPQNYKGEVTCAYSGQGRAKNPNDFDAALCDKADCEKKAAALCGCTEGQGVPTAQPTQSPTPTVTPTPTASICSATITSGRCSSSPFCDCSSNIGFMCSNGKSGSAGNANCAVKSKVYKDICTSCGCTQGCVK